MNLDDLANIRQDYNRSILDFTSVHKDPIQQFNKWLEEAISFGISEPSAMHLATVDKNGLPDGRVVLLKGVDEMGFVFFTNYNSAKGMQLEHSRAAAITFFWPVVERQVRARGMVKRVAESLSDKYFASRPRLSQIGAWASDQSQVIAERHELTEKEAYFNTKFEGKEVPRPKHWGGFCLDPRVIEFWQGRPGRMHDRIVYSKTIDEHWGLSRLAP